MVKFLVGAVVGFLSGLGVGGGSLLLLWLTLVMGVDQPTARGMNLLFFLPCALVATAFRWKQSRPDWRLALPAIAAGLLGALAGTLIATANHTVLALGVMVASQKAENQDVKGGQMVITMSYMGRLAGLFLVLVLCARSGIFNLLALVIPLVFTRPVLTIADHINNKKGGVNS